VHPQTRLLIVISTPLDEWIIKYYLSLLPEDRQECAKKRVRFFNIEDTSPDKYLTQKLCSKKVTIERIQNHCMRSQGRGVENYLMVWRATQHENKLGKLLGLPFYSATPEQALFGTKQGSFVPYSSSWKSPVQTGRSKKSVILMNRANPFGKSSTGIL